MKTEEVRKYHEEQISRIVKNCLTYIVNVKEKYPTLSDCYDELKLCVLAAELWNRGEQEVSYEKEFTNIKLMQDYFYEVSKKYFSVFTRIENEFRAFLEVLEGAACARICIEKNPRYLFYGERTEFNYSFFVKETLTVTGYLIEEGLGDIAKDIISRLICFDFSSYILQESQRILAEGFAALWAANFYFDRKDPETAYEIYEKYWWKMRRTESLEYLILSDKLGTEFAEKDIEKSILPTDQIYELAGKFKQEVSATELWSVQYRYAIHHMQYEENYGNQQYLAILKTLLQEIVQSGLLGKGEYGLDTLFMACAFYVLWEAVYEGQVTDMHLQLALIFYKTSKQYQEQTKSNPIINHKMSIHLLASVYIEQGQWMLAEGYLKEIVDQLDQYANSEIDFYILTNVIKVCEEQNHQDKQIKKYSIMLYKRIMQGEFLNSISQCNIQKAVIVHARMYLISGHPNYAAKIINQALEKGVVYFTEDESIVVLYSLLIMSILLIKKYLSEQERQLFCGYLQQIEESRTYSKLRLEAQSVFLYTKGRLYASWGDTIYQNEFIEMLLNMGDQIKEWQIRSFLQMQSMGIIECMSADRKEDAALLVRQSFQLGLKELEQAMTYQNRERLQSYLDVSQMICFLWYDTLAQCTVQDSEQATEELYKIILNYKNTLSLITGYQKYFTDNAEKNQDLILEIQVLQNLIADEQVNLQIGSSQQSLEFYQKELEKKEFLFAKRAKSRYQMQFFEIKQLMEHIPDQGVFLEYVFGIKDSYKVFGPSSEIYGIHPEGLKNTMYLDVFCFWREGGACRIKKVSLGMVSEHESVWNKLETLLKKRLVAGNPVYQKKLYEWLIAPLEEILTKKDIVYIAPDGELNNMPFGILMDEQGNLLEEKWNLTIVDTGRDFLNKNQEDFAQHTVVIGNPLYDSTAKEQKMITILRKAKLMRKTIQPLPMSEIEARVIAEMTGGSVYIGRDAKKETVFEWELAGRIHIATHGMFDDEMIDGWYSSALLFAGAENWRCTGKEDPVFGNGVVTADEISRMDLSHTELVVLSACYAGRLQTDSGMAGIRAAFRAAGVKYVVSSLWDVDDLAGTILMVQFYRYFQKFEISIALQKAKNYLKNMTVREVREFIEKYAENWQMPGEIETLLYHSLDQDTKLYEDPYYWGAFICTQNVF